MISGTIGAGGAAARAAGAAAGAAGVTDAAGDTGAKPRVRRSGYFFCCDVLEDGATGGATGGVTSAGACGGGIGFRNEMGSNAAIVAAKEAATVGGMAGDKNAFVGANIGAGATTVAGAAFGAGTNMRAGMVE